MIVSVFVDLVPGLNQPRDIEQLNERWKKKNFINQALNIGLTRMLSLLDTPKKIFQDKNC